MRSEIINTIEQVKKGDQAAFKYLVEQYQEYAFRLSFRILCDEEEARDIVQESFIKIWQNIKKYDPKTKFTTWMYTIVTHTAIDRLRSLKHLNLVNIDHVSEHLEGISDQGLDYKLDNTEMGQIIRLMAEDLPGKQRLIFVLRDLQGFDSDEVEQIMKLTKTSVKTNLYHARKAIREKLNKILAYERRML